MSEQRLKMRHPETEGVAETSQKAFDQVWSAKGWELVTVETLVADSSKPELKSLASKKGVDLKGADTKAEIAERIVQEEK